MDESIDNNMDDDVTLYRTLIGFEVISDVIVLLLSPLVLAPTYL